MKKILTAMTICTAIVALAAAFASVEPDGLEWVAMKFGFEKKAANAAYFSLPMPDYNITFIHKPFWSTFLAGTIGAAVVFSLVYFVGWVVKRIHVNSSPL